MSFLPIADYAMLSDRHTAALVSSEGSVEWLCLPRFDSASVFAALLDVDAGRWSIRPVGSFRTHREYAGDSLVLVTTFETDHGTFELRDALVFGPDPDPHDLGQDAPHVLVREVSCLRGHVEVEMCWRPRPGYGLQTPELCDVTGGVVALVEQDRFTLSSSVELSADAGAVRARFTLGTGEKAAFALQHSTPDAVAGDDRSLDVPPPTTHGLDDLSSWLDLTTEAWHEWARLHQTYDGPWAGLVRHSGRVLHGLIYQPTGAVLAAPTTSLPEQIGGGRNWDYRYSWVRDASMTMQALWAAACPDEAHKFFDFIAHAAIDYEAGNRLQTLFGIGGERDLGEHTLPHLSGWRDSAPVRVGNAAWEQSQLDVYGEVLNAASRLRDELGSLGQDTRDFLVELAETAAHRWDQPDEGIWEIRERPRHFVHSKVFCWVALDRACSLAEFLGAEDRVADWQRTADEIRTAVETRGWNEDRQSFTQAFDSTELDASVLLLPIVGFLPYDDPRLSSTIDAIRAELTDERGLVRRYLPSTGVDGLEGDEGTFLLCSFWLAHALALTGRTDEATVIFERAAGHVNDVGLLSEEVDPATGELLGNFPQAFSHVGLINAAWALHQAASEDPLTRS